MNKNFIVNNSAGISSLVNPIYIAANVSEYGEEPPYFESLDYSDENLSYYDIQEVNDQEIDCGYRDDLDYYE